MISNQKPPGLYGHSVPKRRSSSGFTPVRGIPLKSESSPRQGIAGEIGNYTLGNIQKAMENHYFFSLPEGNSFMEIYGEFMVNYGYFMMISWGEKHVFYGDE